MTEDARQVILAKRPRDRQRPAEQETFLGHSRAVADAFRIMFGTTEVPTRLGQEWLRFFKLGLEDNWLRFHRASTAACALHDLGKANSGFQAAVRGNEAAQVLRHEHLSALILSLPSVATWLGGACQTDSGVVIPAVLGHHLKARADTDAEHPYWTLGSLFSADRDLLTLQTEGVVELLALTADLLGAARLDSAEIPVRWSFRGRTGWFDAASHAERTREKLNYLGRTLASDASLGHLLHLLAAVRTALILADSAGSGLVRENKPIEDWLRSAFDENLCVDGSAVQSKVIKPRISDLSAKGRWDKWHDFQEAAAKLPARALMLAPCGSGKTLAAWRWIAAQAEMRPAARVIFLYPTRGTATEGFRDYVSWAPEADAALLHSTSEYELQGMFEEVQDSRRDKDYTTDDRLYALAYWQRRMFSATVDQFLGFMQHSYRSTCLMPVLADSIVVFDEVHSFDKSLFSALRRFLQEFDIPVLCMTASLPSQRIEGLSQCGLAVFPQDLTQFQDLKAKAERKRYAVAGLADATAAEKAARTAFAEGRRVLWVVNTVDRCQALARRLDALCYHSRFKLDDRRKRHGEAVLAFRPGGPAVVAVTTQVCEMSLDLDADVLITEHAPVTSLIQRMGRCNRHDVPGDARTGQVFLYPPESGKPYSKDDLVGLEGFVSALNGKTVSQSYLQELLEQYGPREVEVDRYAAFLESGPWAASREEPLREGGDYTADAILDRDLNIYKALKKNGKPVDGLVVPVPRRLVGTAERIDRYAVAPAKHYNKKWGFMEKPYGEET